MIMTCIIIDDDKHLIELLSGYIAEIPFLSLIKSYRDPLIALKEIRSGKPVDLVFMDIEMDELSGIELYQLIKDKIRSLIIISAHLKYTLDAFDIDAKGFLLKPFSLVKFKSVVSKIAHEGLRHDESRPFIWIKCDPNHQIKKVFIDDIIYVEGASNYIKIHTVKRSYIIYGKMSDFESELTKEFNFIRVHKSYIVSGLYISKIQSDHIFLTDEVKIKIGSTYKLRVSNYLKSLTSNSNN